MSDENVGGLVAKWRDRIPVGDKGDEYSHGYDDALRHCACELQSALGKAGPDNSMVESACRAHYGERWLRMSDGPKMSAREWMRAALEAALSAHGQPVVDERINRAWKLVERWEQPTIDGDTLTKEERLRNMGFAAMLRAALGDTP